MFRTFSNVWHIYFLIEIQIIICFDHICGIHNTETYKYYESTKYIRNTIFHKAVDYDLLTAGECTIHDVKLQMFSFTFSNNIIYIYIYVYITYLFKYVDVSGVLCTCERVRLCQCTCSCLIRIFTCDHK